MKIFYPSVFNDQPAIDALFSEANRGDVNRSGRIPGLNLGYNTDVPRQEIDRNFDRLHEEIGWDRDLLAIANQVHSTHIEHVSRPGIYDNTDGFVTTTPGLSLGIRVADCAAVLAGDPERGVVAAFHAGWKGAAGGILSRGMEIMAGLGAVPDQIRVYISPCISFKNFEVGEEVAKKFPDQFVDRKSYEKPHVDLKGYLMWQLIGAGVRPGQIEISNTCTMQDNRFYSYRRERDKAGRMLGMIKLNR